jgi:predicted RNase H-like HicB family nuclease
MKHLKVIINKTRKGVSAHLPEVGGFIIARDSAAQLKKDLRSGIEFHIEGLYEEERQSWMNEEYDFEFIFNDIPSLIEAYNQFINQSSLARISGINESQMRQYVAGIKQPTKKTMKRIEEGLRKYARELSSVSFA